MDALLETGGRPTPRQQSRGLPQWSLVPMIRWGDTTDCNGKDFVRHCEQALEPITVLINLCALCIRRRIV